MLSPAARKFLLPRLSIFCKSNVNVCRMGFRQAHTMPPAKKVAFKSVSVAVLGLGLGFLRQPTVNCDSIDAAPPVHKNAFGRDLPPPPESAVSLYELGFGTVAGLCAGVFVKKGVKAAAWLLGGVFVLLQYMASQSLVRVDWSKVASRFEARFHTADASGKSRAPTVGSIRKGLVNFLTADFQPRASFIAGFVLGIRVG